ncbi:MAG: glycoside hydrolase family 3 C-terminal domain-containing protein [Lentimicrobiaceae bacterium]|nr:glycoside hydrolase family 3 C-terminal domain-containing protein [Lentimicrobiaceae bacterium]MCO5265920.1 glycoside hydrolase family 3 C-terminal domain-containing protein [Lentimicrobium sp.]HPG33551.1 glycoside hydrolase family 3 N-terminal domain-containing protein [Lentimicrobium sp.]
MKQISHFIIFLIAAFLAVSCRFNQKTTHTNDNVEAKVEALLQKMSVEEKVGQMMQVTLDVLTYGENPQSSYEPVMLDTAMLHKAFAQYHIGSVLNTANNSARDPQQWNRLIGQIQDYCIKESPNKIPVIYGLDMIHGASYAVGATLFPQQTGLAATWNTEHAKIAGEITAYETKATGASWIFSPVMDLGVDPRWPRFWETFGEDPYLAAITGKAFITGAQGANNTIGASNHVATCLKHFMGYSQPRTGKDRTPALIPSNMLREYHLVPFKKAIDAGALTVMINSSVINGLPAHADKNLISGILKTELNFQGFAVSDWQDIEYLHTRHKIAESPKEAVKIAVNAGVDMSMVPFNFDFADYLLELVNEGEVPMERIDDAVRRILRVKFLLGLFEKPYTLAADYPDFGSERFAALALQATEESITLLKNNDHILPLNKHAKILVAGPAANSMRPLNGGWTYTWQGDMTDEFAADYHTIFEALQMNAARPENVVLCETVRYNTSGDYRGETVDSFEKFKQQALQADYILLCIGENSYTETPGNLNDLYLSDNQQELIKTAASTGKPVILILVEGRPRIISKAEPLVSGILHAYLPGNYGGQALASIIYGDVNPSGKLPYTYPRYPNSLELYYHAYTEQLKDASSGNGQAFNPQFEFGYGLSYSKFEYSELSISKTMYKPGETIKGSVKVLNNSTRAGMEVIQVYVSDLVASLTPPVKRLRSFSKIMLQPGEMQTVQFEIPVNDLAFVNQQEQWLIEKGEFTLTINQLSQTFKISESKTGL